MSVPAPMKLGAIHAITGRQWRLDTSEAWPDLEIVLPFTRRVSDNTGTVIGPAVSPEIQGGYEVRHLLNRVELFDLVHNVDVPNVKGVWAAGPGGDTFRLHLLAQDPFSWLTPHLETSSTATETPSKVVDQLFGYGPQETFSNERRFHEMLVKPAETADLTRLFQPSLPTRVMRSSKFHLRFRTSLDARIKVDELVLFIIGYREIPGIQTTAVGLNLTASLSTTPPSSISYSYVEPVYGDLFLIAANVSLGTALDEITINSSSKGPLLVYAVRYREARETITAWSQRVILVPGRYRITVDGQSSATNPSGLPPSQTVNWHLEQEFGVKYPETIRPYVNYATIGDSRLFRTDPVDPSSPSAWDPSLRGIGFPIYRQYRGLVRFLVPYMSQIFSPIKMRLAYEEGVPPPTISQSLTLVTNPDGTSSMQQKSQDWVTAAGGTVPPDEEIIFTTDFPQNGQATVSLLYDVPGGDEVKLDEWSCYVSQYDSFTQHLTWPNDCLQTFYDAVGRHVNPCCPTVAGIHRVVKSRYSASVGSRLILSASTDLPSRLLVDPLQIGGIQPYPQELTSPPIDWQLPTWLAENLQPLNTQTGILFARFANRTGARFDDGAGDRIEGIQDTVDQTTVEAVVDSERRPYALWLRTPEPVDWRRVSASLKIQHVEQTGDCPSRYSHRESLDLAIVILPSPDATSAFLIGSFAGILTRLPRGDYELTLSFDPTKSGMPKLRPKPSVGALPETVKVRFIQPLGLDWPQPSTPVIIPAGLLEVLFKYYLPPGPGPGPDPRRIYEDTILVKELGQQLAQEIHPAQSLQESTLSQSVGRSQLSSGVGVTSSRTSLPFQLTPSQSGTLHSLDVGKRNAASEGKTG